MSRSGYYRRLSHCQRCEWPGCTKTAEKGGHMCAVHWGEMLEQLTGEDTPLRVRRRLKGEPDE